MNFKINTLEAGKLQGLKDKLTNGEKLSESELLEIRANIDGLRSSAAFLLQTATDLEALLKKQTSV